MTIKELKPLIGQAWSKSFNLANELAKSDNPQTRDLYNKARAEAELLQDIINAMGGNTVQLKIRGE